METLKLLIERVCVYLHDLEKQVTYQKYVVTDKEINSAIMQLHAIIEGKVMAQETYITELHHKINVKDNQLLIREAVHSQNHELLTLLKLAKAEFDSDIDYLPVPTQVEVSKVLEKINETIKKYAD